MVVKPFSHLARQGFAKTLVHGYAQSAVAASQSSYATNSGSLGHLHNYPVHKFARTAQLQAGFQTASGSSGAGTKTGHAGHDQPAAGDGSLAAYYAAWQHAQQTGDESDWRQHQFSRKIGWKSGGSSGEIKRKHRHDLSLTPDSLRPLRPSVDRAVSEADLNNLKATSEAEAEALDRVNEAIAQEIQAANFSTPAADTRYDSSSRQVADDGEGLSRDFGRGTQASGDELDSTAPSTDGLISDVATKLSSPAAEADPYSIEISELASSAQYSQIPAVFERMLKDGLVPTVEAYNAILLSAIHLTRNVYQILPKALEVYGDMVRRQVSPNEDTHAILVDFLTGQARDAHTAKDILRTKQVRFGSSSGAFLFKSSELEHQLLAEDSSLEFALQQYQMAQSRFSTIKFPVSVYSALIQACAQHSRLSEMVSVLSDMKAQNITPPTKLFAPIITAFAKAKDLKAANKYYEEYRALAVSSPAGNLDAVDMQDIMVYAALIKAFLSTGHAAGGFKFFDRILTSYESGADTQTLRTAMENSFCNVFVEHALDAGDPEGAVAFTQSRALSQESKDQMLGQISAYAADASTSKAADSALELISSNSPELVNAKSAVLAADIRLGKTGEARMLWSSLIGSQQLMTFPLHLTTMYTNASLRDGNAEEALSQARVMFQRVRDSAPDQRSRTTTVELIDEALVSFGEILLNTNAKPVAQANMYLIRMMLENGGLVSPAAEHAIGSIGPDCVNQLNPQDVALALHVQIGMLSQSSRVSDPAHLVRSAYLLETVLNRGIPLDPSTVHAVTESSSKLNELRPDLSQRWHGLLQPAAPLDVGYTSQVTSSPVSPVFDVQPQQDSFDPYAHNTDFRASSFIADQLESTTGRLENHLREALSRLRDVRRVGRHPRYTTYSKLITAAGKTGQVHLVHEVFEMARHDVPLNMRSTAVRSGWVAIFDAMVAAYLTTGDRQLASTYHRDLLNIGAAPSANTFGLYITTLKESTKTFDEATEAVKIFQQAISEGVEPGVFLYNAVIGKLGKARRIDDCLFYFGDMQSRKVKPTSVTYGTLVNALCRTSEERFAEEMFDEMESMPNYRPRAAPYNSIIQFFLNTKRDRSKVLTYFERMKSQHIKPTSHTFKLLIEAHATLEPVNLEAAEAVLDDMKAAGMEPEAVHYGSLIHARGCVMHDMTGARAVFDSVLSCRTIRPTDNLYQNLFEAMVANHQVAKTPQVLIGMARRSVEMTAYIANTLIHGWAAEGSIAQAKSVFDSLGYTKREPSTYEAMTRAFLSIEDHQSASSVVQEMLSKRYPSAVADKILVLVGSPKS